MGVVDKQKHANEFRLRILLTNKCDKSCENCLNDFQLKGEEFIDLEFVKDNIREYIDVCRAKKVSPIISLSGGEPGLHPEFDKIVMAAIHSGAKVQVNTNGLIDEFIFDTYSVDIRYHMGHGLRNTVKRGQTAVFVLSEKYTLEGTKEFIKPFYDGGMRIKTFADYYSSEYFRTEGYKHWLKELSHCFPISGRHTGVQENRGEGCDGCTNTCVTLKALWLFPNNTRSYCPQISRPRANDSMLMAFTKHLRVV